MKKLITGIPLLLMSLPVLAVDEETPVTAPQVDADPTALIVFAFVFVGLIGYYAYVIWKSEQKKSLSK